MWMASFKSLTASYALNWILDKDIQDYVELAPYRTSDHKLARVASAILTNDGNLAVRREQSVWFYPNDLMGVLGGLCPNKCLQRTEGSKMNESISTNMAL